MCLSTYGPSLCTSPLTWPQWTNSHQAKHHEGWTESGQETLFIGIRFSLAKPTMNYLNCYFYYLLSNNQLAILTCIYLLSNPLFSYLLTYYLLSYNPIRLPMVNQTRHQLSWGSSTNWMYKAYLLVHTTQWYQQTVTVILQDISPSMQDPPFWRVHQCHVAAELPISQVIALLLALCCKGRKKQLQ